MCEDKLIDDCFDLFCLDRRASQKEVEIAYDVLTKGTPSLYKEYRLAFEYLMHNYYHVTYEEEDFLEDEEDISIKNEEISSIVLNNTPDIVKTALDFFKVSGEKIYGNLDDISRAIFSIQKVNLPMFFQAIYKNAKFNILGKPYWDVSSMDKIIRDACLNPILYYDMTFELSDACASIRQTINIQDFCMTIKKIFIKYKKLCQKFECHDTKTGCMCHIIADAETINKIENLVVAKAKQCDYTLNLTTNLPHEQEE